MTKKPTDESLLTEAEFQEALKKGIANAKKGVHKLKKQLAVTNIRIN